MTVAGPVAGVMWLRELARSVVGLLPMYRCITISITITRPTGIIIAVKRHHTVT